MSVCPVCGAELELPRDAIEGELLACEDCGAELELLSISPVRVTEASATEEDWDQ